MLIRVRKTIFLFLAAWAIWSANCLVAFAKLPLSVEIGKSIDANNFRIVGYGVLVRYAKECLVIAPAHVVADTVEDIFVDPVNARMGSLGETSLSRVDHNRDRDIYVGKVGEKDTLSKFCPDTEDLTALNKDYQLRLQHMMARDFTSIQLHMAPGTVNLVPETPQTLQEIQNSEPIRYRMGKCTEVDGDACGLPVQGYSGSTISVAIGPSDRLWLGLHQKRCGEDCSGTEPVWQAISLMQIYAYVTTDYFRAKLKLGPADEPVIERPVPPTGEALVRMVQSELTRLQCQPGDIDGRWGEGSRKALKRFSVAYSQDVPNEKPSVTLLAMLNGQPQRDCPPLCAINEVLRNGSCERVAPVVETSVPKTGAPAPRALPDPVVTPAPPKPKTTASPRTKKPSTSTAGNCIRVNGQLACPVP